MFEYNPSCGYLPSSTSDLLLSLFDLGDVRVVTDQLGRPPTPTSSQVVSTRDDPSLPVRTTESSVDQGSTPNKTLSVQWKVSTPFGTSTTPVVRQTDGKRDTNRPSGKNFSQTRHVGVQVVG